MTRPYGNSPSTYTYTVEDGVICIVDQNRGRSVTNDAEYVIEDLHEKGLDLDKLPVIYRDTLGVWDQLRVEKGEFLDFHSLGATRDKETAKERVKNPKWRGKQYRVPDYVLSREIDEQ
jgi:hypothetical protein